MNKDHEKHLSGFSTDCKEPVLPVQTLQQWCSWKWQYQLKVPPEILCLVKLHWSQKDEKIEINVIDKVLLLKINH